MSKTSALLLLNEDLSKVLLRISTGGLMLFHGFHKVIYGHDQIRQFLAQKGLPEILWVGVPVAEVVAPILLIFGILGRVSALLITVVMLFSIYLGFGLDAFTITDRPGGLRADFNIYFIFVSLALFFLGSGKYVLYKNKNQWLQ